MKAELGLYAVVITFAILIGGTIVQASGSFAASVLVDVSIIAYALLLTSDPIYRHSALALALGAHIVAIAKYYSHPLIAPFLIFERSSHGTTINIDIVQIVIVYELISERKTLRKLLKGLSRESKESRVPREPP